MKKLICLIFCLVLLICAVPAEQIFAETNLAKKNFFDEAFGTSVSATLYGNDENTLSDAFDSIMAEFKAVENAVSVSVAASDIARFNALSADDYIENAHPFTVEILKEAKRLYAMTNGAFNPCAYLLNDLWQLSPRFNESIATVTPYDRNQFCPPQQQYVDAFINLMDFDSIVVEEFSSPIKGVFNRITKTCPSVIVDGQKFDMQIDLGAIGKGFAADRAKQFLISNGITNGFVSIGGSSVIALENPNGESNAWSVGLIDPQAANQWYFNFEMKNSSLATSGDYQLGKFYMYDGIRYCHIMDTKSGAPIRTNIRTASAWGFDLTAAEADALTTAVMAMGHEKALVFLNSPQIVSRGIKIVYVFEKQWTLGSVFEVVTNADKSEFEISNTDYRLRGSMQNGEFKYTPLNPDLWLGLTVVAVVVAVGATAAVFAALRKTQKEKKSTPLKKQPFFRRGDIIVYASALALVVVLLTVFVFAPAKDPLLEIHIVHKNITVFVFDLNSQTGSITAAGYEDLIEVSTVDGTTYISIEIGEGHNNIIAVRDGKAWMHEANCSWRKDCVTAFAPLTQGGQAIVCDPHHLKVVGVGQNETTLLLNG